ncbi:Flp pilus assembly pilin Flp [Elusimicrobium simillimum]|uniref:class III signal peptide-containing protein n=1 Tax=Elusimicrobium simillimum TaxID=3143438 RepID=UPI003C7045A4
MKLIVKMQVALAQLKNKKGQGTVEYALMLAVIVGIALAAGLALKQFMPELFENVKQRVLGGLGGI